MISSREEAETFVSACRYPPADIRGAAGTDPKFIAEGAKAAADFVRRAFA